MTRKATLKELDALIRKIAVAYRPKQIILFGSYAYGKPEADSDVDVMVVMPFKGRPAFKAAEILHEIKPSIPVDLIVRSPAQIRNRLALNDFFIREVIDKGKVLYENPY